MVGPTLGAKVRDMRPATRVVINTAPRAPALSPAPSPHATPLPSLTPANTQWGTAIELNFGTVVVVRIRGWFCR